MFADKASATTLTPGCYLRFKTFRRGPRAMTPSLNSATMACHHDANLAAALTIHGLLSAISGKSLHPKPYTATKVLLPLR